ncbi:hypothetical protein F5X96DRAFT_628872 [Biscogniauxia mediterranea]|nr:hypothetical protein F5X96DRAFT_628872 [Biscogniauxia mediterranea]
MLYPPPSMLLDIAILRSSSVYCALTLPFPLYFGVQEIGVSTQMVVFIFLDVVVVDFPFPSLLSFSVSNVERR